MTRFLLATSLFMLLAGTAVPSAAGNPFQGGGPAVRESGDRPIPAGLFVRIAAY
jgi:hypothetical protein